MSWKDSSTCIHGDLTGDVFSGWALCPGGERPAYSLT